MSPTAKSWKSAVDPVSKKQHFDVPGEIFATGLPYQVPAGGMPGGIKNVAWSASFSTDTPGVKVKWEWGAAVYSSFSSNNSLLGVKPVDNGKAPLSVCEHRWRRHAGELQAVPDLRCDGRRSERLRR